MGLEAVFTGFVDREFASVAELVAFDVWTFFPSAVRLRREQDILFGHVMFHNASLCESNRRPRWASLQGTSPAVRASARLSEASPWSKKMRRFFAADLRIIRPGGGNLREIDARRYSCGEPEAQRNQPVEWRILED